MIKEFVQKSIETESGFPAQCWVATGIWIDLKANIGVITLEGYKDFEAKEAGKQVMGTLQVNIPDINVMSSYAAVKANVLTAVCGNDKFAGATLEQREVAG